ncbi:hypothetical protein SEA_A3WALLY_335 [Microbacterium phage A3Wally]|nr:hypothetical protein SEA_A3WALLY_335 [Microbacterium phage A3Wally]
MEKRRKGKARFTRKSRRAVCGCRALNGSPKTLYSQKWLATKGACDVMDKGKMWQTYKCPEGLGWHIGTVRWDPWGDRVVGLDTRSGGE